MARRNRGTRERRRHLRAAYRVLLAGGVVLLGIGVTTAVAFSDTETVNDRTAAMNQSLDDLRLLTQARDELSTAQIQFADALAETDSVTMAGRIADVLDAYNDGLDSWDAYKQRPTVDATSPRIQEIDTMLRAVRDAGEQIAAQAIADPTRREAWEAMFSDQVETYNFIRSEFDDLEGEALAVVDAKADELADQAARDQRIVLVAGAAAIVLTSLVTIVVAVGADRRERAQDVAEHDRATVARRNALDANLQSALDMADTEDHALSVVGRALAEALPERSVEVLLAGVGGAVARAVAAGPETSGCQVPSPERCPAARNGQRLVFPTPSSLDACWYLQDRPDGPCSAVCAPLSVAGNAVGIVHVVAPDGQPPGTDELATIDLIARKTSESLSTIRAFGHASSQARTDPLTGLLNRRSLEHAASILDDEGAPYIVAFADLDRFKALNDTHGHAAGDNALRLFARVLRSSVRPDDITARWGGEEFLLVLPNCTIDGAVEILERIRANLSVALAGTDAPPFTVSFGVAPSSAGSAFSSVVSLADEYLLQAKAEGRNRIVSPSA